MSRIKNTKELVLRAQGHARLDHITQGTYGNASCNGFVEFEGCAIGCLATPHRKSELRSFIRRLGHRNYDGEYELSEDGDAQLARLRKEFGICPALGRCAEAIFEGLHNHGEAINFIPAFAKALPEGANITPRKVRQAWERITDYGSADPSTYPRVRGDYDVDLSYGRAEDVQGPFLDWLRSQA